MAEQYLNSLHSLCTRSTETSKSVSNKYQTEQSAGYLQTLQHSCPLILTFYVSTCQQLLSLVCMQTRDEIAIFVSLLNCFTILKQFFYLVFL